MAEFRPFTVSDVRFPTSRSLDGSDAMNPDPDYSAAYVTVPTSDGDAGDGFVFTIGRGNEVAAAAIHAVEALVVGLDVDSVLDDMGAFWRRLVSDSQLRWLGPEKGVIHMAVGAVVNAVWDLKARRAGLPLWALLAEMSPRQLVELVDFTYLADALTPDDALELLERMAPTRRERMAQLREAGYPAYTTSAGWLGYSDEKVTRLVGEAVEDGFTHLKLKVGADIDDDERRVKLVRGLVGPDILISVDANQRWGVGDAIANVRRLAPHGIHWVEEPTSPDDILGHRAVAEAVHPVRVATGEHAANAVMFKQLITSGAIDICQIDACRVAGVNENVAILLLAAKYGVPVCPHAGGVGLCEVVQHLSMFDFVAVSGSTEGRWIEYVDHLHEHFEDPAVVRGGAYRAPRAPGSGARMLPSTVRDYSFPDGVVWNAPADETTGNTHHTTG
ncbi:enolase C-terminal domain-like protein [Flexivirga alba]|jgi:L-alanine-DL-glutamate epimerase and related enzymes of enolase superfamily|uniref:L-fuconate dehydratase n=1 Tax=Flexivirga alba TaxID=702742 RepID=A0ABW2ABF2_9MICO